MVDDIGKSATQVKADTKPKTTSEDAHTDEESLSSVGGKNVADPAGGGDGSLPGKTPGTFLDSREVDDKHIEAGQNKDEVQAVRDSSKEADKAAADAAKAERATADPMALGAGVKAL